MKFEIVQNGTVIETKELAEGSWKIGRAPECEIQLRSAQVSKQHALLVIKGERAAILDLGSSNGVFVNGVLVRKQRLEMKDEVGIADFIIRAPRASKFSAKEARGNPLTDGNLALNLNYEVDSASSPVSDPETPQDKFLSIVNTKVLAPLYGLLKTADWRLVLASVLGVTLVASVVLSAIPMVHWARKVTTQESLARAQTVLNQMVRENYRILAKTTDSTRLTVEAAEAEKGILSCYIIDGKTDTVLAPTKLYNQAITDVYALDAIKRVTEKKQDFVSVQKDDSIWILAAPIYLFSQDSNERELSAIVLATFEVPSGISSTFEPMTVVMMFAATLALGAWFLIYKMVTYPISQMHDQVDAALKGDDVTVTSEARLPELEILATSLNFAISRFKQSGGGAASAVVGVSNNQEGTDLEDAGYVLSVQEFDSGTSDALLLLDRDKQVKYVGKILEDLIGMRNQYAQGQNISDACRDQSFAGTAIDLCDRVIQSLGQNQTAVLDVNGISRNIFAVGHKNNMGEIRFVLITVKMTNA